METDEKTYSNTTDPNENNGNLLISKSFVEELHKHFTHQDKLVGKLTKSMAIVLGVLVLMMIFGGVQVFMLIQNMDRQMLLMKDEMSLVNGHMMSIHEYMVSMDTGIKTMAEDTGLVTDNMYLISRHMDSMATDMHAMPKLRQDMTVIAETMILMRNDTASMQDGIRRMVSDTRSMSQPFRYMPFP